MRRADDDVKTIPEISRQKWARAHSRGGARGGLLVFFFFFFLRGCIYDTSSGPNNMLRLGWINSRIARSRASVPRLHSSNADGTGARGKEGGTHRRGGSGIRGEFLRAVETFHSPTCGRGATGACIVWTSLRGLDRVRGCRGRGRRGREEVGYRCNEERQWHPRPSLICR
jgi:hypothetical protein